MRHVSVSHTENNIFGIKCGVVLENQNLPNKAILQWPVLFIQARTPSMAGYSYGNSFDV